MKFFKTALIFLFILVIAITVALYVAFKTTDINQVAQKLTKDVSDSLGMDIYMEGVKVELSATRGLVLHLKQVVFEERDQKQEQQDPFFRAESLSFEIIIRELIFHKKIFISRLVLETPRVLIIKNKKGELNIPTKVPALDPERADKISDQSMPSGLNFPALLRVSTAFASDLSEKQPTHPAFYVEDFSVINGEILYQDESLEILDKPWNIPVKELSFKIDDFSPEEQFDFSLTASLWSEDKNIAIQGKALVDSTKNQMRLDDLILESDLKLLHFEKCYNSLPIEKDIFIKRDLQGLLKVTIHQMIVGEEGVIVFLSQSKLRDARTILKQLDIPVVVSLVVEVNESDGILSDLKIDIASGEVKGRGRINEYLTDQAGYLNLQWDNVSLGDLLGNMDLPYKLEGKVFGQLEGQGQLEDLLTTKQTLSGDGSLNLVEGRIVDINYFRMIIEKLSQIPQTNLKETLEKHMPAKYKEKLKQKDTLIPKVDAVVQLQKDNMIIKDFILDAEGFFIKARGFVKGGTHCKIEGDFYFPQDLSSLMVEGAQEFSYFLEKDLIKLALTNL